MCEGLGCLGHNGNEERAAVQEDLIIRVEAAMAHPLTVPTSQGTDLNEDCMELPRSSGSPGDVITKLITLMTRPTSR